MDKKDTNIVEKVGRSTGRILWVSRTQPKESLVWDVVNSIEVGSQHEVVGLASRETYMFMGRNVYSTESTYHKNNNM